MRNILLLLLILLFSTLSAVSLSGCSRSETGIEAVAETTSIAEMTSFAETTSVVETTHIVDSEVYTEVTSDNATTISDSDTTQNSTVDSTELQDPVEVQDPHSYLSLVVGNADVLSFEYIRTNPETQASFLGQFYKSEGLSGERFEANDQNGEIITITELELPDGVYYVDESKQKVYHYQGLAEDMLLYKLMNITSYAPISIMDATEGKYYIYEIPFEQDTTKNYHYELLMTPNGIKTLDTFLDDQYVSNITFMEFQNIKLDTNFLKIPEAYTLENFDYGVKDINIPPWW